MLNFVALSICLLVLAWEPHHQAQASRIGFKDKKTILGGEISTDHGLCASSVVVHGYECHEHEVTTEDGYILSLQRIPEGRAKTGGNVTKKEPVIVQHGILVDGMSWFLNSPEQNLPMVLADNGFDVWITNTRGTRFSRRHTSLDPSSQAYWQWSWDELVTYELPAIFDYVSNQTGQKINYVGHSLGTLVPLAAFSEAKLVNQLKSAALLSPIAYLSHMTTLVGVVAASSFVGEALNLMGNAEFDPRGSLADEFLGNVCAQPGVDCSNLFTALSGDNCCISSSAADVFLRDALQPTSTMTLVHLSQTVRTGVLSKYDYESLSRNLQHYGRFFPPKYNLPNIPHDLPLFMSYGGLDALSDVTDIANLLNDLKYHNKDRLNVQYIKEYAHSDFIMGGNANDRVYKAMIAFLKRQF
ncbi:triacylglycerol lipase 2-like [Lotus japonicus]|uniref:triacylglycerol lipase 2-like n=1 Tax=Lotus japonicus TaxID=34305 RepID=UPI00258FD033|nr:triacylglycerol lipase 2-like [Lotus japonicus]